MNTVRLHRAAAALLLLTAAAFAQEQGLDRPPALPPGVRVLAADELPAPPLHGEIAGLQVDWRHPMLRVDAASAPQAAGATLPRRDDDRWPRDADADPETPELWLQLLEPLETAPDAEAPPPESTPTPEPDEPGAPRRMAPPRVTPEEAAAAFWYRAVTGEALAGLWIDPAHGVYPAPAEPDPLWPEPPAAWFTRLIDPRQPTIAAPPAEPAERWRCAVRWMGRGSEVAEHLPAIPFRQRALISLSDPATGQTRWLLLMRPDGRPDNLEAWRETLAATAGPREWLAVHAMGPQVRIGAGTWRLGERGDPRRSERLGAALILRAIRPGEPIDWARLAGAVTQASSHEANNPPQQVLEQGWWPLGFGARGWLSRPASTGGPSGSEAHTWQIDLNRPRPLQRVIALQPADWPGEITSGMTGQLTADDAPWSDADAAASEGLPRRRLRLSFDPAAAEDHAGMAGIQIDDARARLHLFEVWGPWDGTTPAAPR